MLTKGISVHFSSKNHHLREAFEVASGTMLITSDEAESCFVAKNDWQMVNPLEMDILRSDSRDVSDIYLLSLPKSNVQEFQSEIVTAVARKNYQHSLRASTERFARSAVSWLNSLRLPFQYYFLGADLAFAGPGLNSTAFDHLKGIYKGLHIDDHEKLALTKRREAFILFNINLGDAIRYFQFINHQLSSIVNILQDVYSDEDIGLWPTHKIKDAFFTHHPEYSVTRALLPPGHAYLCQTQNVIHDGATNSEGHADISLLIALKVTS
ncbi:MAG: hypothetical protein GDA65_05845 [Nitrospira sp. CR1.1]|nr:hypothetical protein [Nitrospira sp. CR1.1]